jgi:hypothetical protein
VLPYRLDQLDEAALLHLCDEQTSESITLEFKRELPIKDAAAKIEFAKDVSAMANAGGGDIVYGIEEKAGTALRLYPISVPSMDSEIRRLAQVLDGGVEPRIPGIQYKSVEVAGGHLLVLRIPQSFDGPHRITSGGDGRFVLRAGSHIADMTYDQIKTAFDRTATLAEKAEAFRLSRIQAISDGNVPKRLYSPGPVLVIQLIPLSGIAGRFRVDVAALERTSVAIMSHGLGLNSSALNLDGVVSYGVTSTPEEGSYAYMQVYRNGIIESAFHGGSYANDGIIPSTTITVNIREFILRSLELLKQADCSGPIVLGVAALNVDGYQLGVGNTYRSYRNTTHADRKDLVIPEVWIEGIDTLVDVDAVIRPVLDILWQSFGVERCAEYSTEGKWAPRP